MSLNDGRVPGDYGNKVFEALSSGRSRAVLDALRHRSTPVSVEELAATLAANDETGERRILIELTHTVLPKLEDAGLAERTESGVAATDHPAFDDPVIDRLVEADADRAFEALADQRRRIALSVLRSHSSSVDRRSLARTVAARERGVPASDVTEETVSDVLASLHHAHLPVLEDAALIQTDDEQQEITYDGHRAFDDDEVDVAVGAVVIGD